MPIYSIIRYPDPSLREKASRVERVMPRERKILAHMAETMYCADGVGLAGPQVGIGEQFIVVDAGEGLIKMVNPEIISKQGESKMEEGCLSLPGVVLNVKRANRILVEGLNEEGERIQIPAEGVLAHALQHEIDHLHGILIIDKAEEQEKEKFRLKGESSGKGIFKN